jgi:hypothetical protein
MASRTAFGKFIKVVFIAFNILMLIWLIAGLGTTAEQYNSSNSEAYRAGTAIGGTIGVGIIVGFWAAGDIIIGIMVLLTRPKS